MQKNMPCPCGSTFSYNDCCGPLHKGIKKAPHAKALMQARYSAYALHLPRYVVATTHPYSNQYQENQRQWKSSILNFCRTSLFERLEILDFQEHGSMATVTFTAFIKERKSDTTFTEKSFFEKYQDEWLYLHGKIVHGHIPSFATNAQLKLLPLAYYNDPILREKAQPIDEISQDIKTLAYAMMDTMEGYDGIGIAAPQVHQSVRLFLMRRVIEQKDGSLDWESTEVVINPEVLEQSKDSWEHNEGCLSIPGLRAPVTRASTIRVLYTTLEGERKEESLHGWTARVFLHEYDHLNGVLFIDRLSTQETKCIIPLLKEIEHRKTTRETL